MSGFDLERFREALEEPPSIVARIQHAMLSPGHRAMVEVANALDDYERHASRPQGYRPDGTVVSMAEKKRILAFSDRVRAKRMAELAEEGTPPLAVAASALPMWAGGTRPPLEVW